MMKKEIGHMRSLIHTLIHTSIDSYLKIMVFCRYWQDIEGKVWVDPAIKMTHLGRMRYEGTMMSFLERNATYSDKK
jgi:hypothetical protein